ncbi:unnamed protein product [Cyprideis torosa]|uniref:Clustered mitochondria protein homolog n=1 Tax=Cyprideis torosa TaxID=163714 RepID=A0A7R8ZJU4_9CRUS|nr:unnamed protein product [Cyprideis torosa]CAG0889278.1 unnamed protein product [Cyprideis torosa]
MPVASESVAALPPSSDETLESPPDVAPILLANGSSSAENAASSNEHNDEDSIPNGTPNGDSSVEGNESCASPESEKSAVEKKDDDELSKDDEKKEKEKAILGECGFNVKVCPQGAEPFDVQVNTLELVQEIHQLLVDREETCTRTCFSLQLDGHRLDNFSELKNVEGLKEGSVVKVVEEPYTVREARIHVRHVRDLLKSLDPQDAFQGLDCASLSFLNTITQGEIDTESRRKKGADSVDCTPPEHILPGAEDAPLTALVPLGKDPKGPLCVKGYGFPRTHQVNGATTILGWVKTPLSGAVATLGHVTWLLPGEYTGLPIDMTVLTYSGWNPPPGPRRMKGDLLYLYVVTLESKKFHITSCTKGFYLNLSSDEVFNPLPASPHHLSHSLVDLLTALSPGFKKAFQTLIKKRSAKHPFERVPTPYQIYTWVSPALDHGIDIIRAEDAFSSKLGYEEHIPGQTRDWNEELQATRELPRKNIPDRLLRERAIFKVHSDFVTAANRGAVAVIDGNVMAINPGEEPKMHMFIWNNIFFSLGFDVRDHYKELGGDAAAHRNDLLGVRVYSNVDLEGLYTLGTVVIDYRGYRVTAQSIIPGILEREQEQSVVYGSIDFGKTIVTHDKYRELLSKAGSQLKILPHSVVNAKGESVELCSSVECKGIIGNDGRHYILDLLRTFPPDVNFLDTSEFGVDDMVSDPAKALGLPIFHAHKLCCLRQELIDAFVDSRYLTFVKHAALAIQERERGLQKKSEEDCAGALKDKEEEPTTQAEPDVDEAKQMVEKIQKRGSVVETGESSGPSASEPATGFAHEAIKSAARAVHSLKEADFDIRFNPDVFSPGLSHPDEDALGKERQIVADTAEFLVSVQIPAFIRECLDHSSAPLDGSALVEAMHGRGINVRYLGKFAELIAKIPSLRYLYTMAVSELITRSAKHLFVPYMQGVESLSISIAISHFLNCFLGSHPSPHATSGEEGLVPARVSKKRRNRRGGGNQGSATAGPSSRGHHPSSEQLDWIQMTPKTFWNQLKKETLSYYGFKLTADGVDSVCPEYSLQKISLLRSFCLKVGIQILLRDYQFDSKQKPTFSEEDITNVFPVIKHIAPRASDAYQFYSAGQNKIQQGFLKEGYDLVTEALSLLNNVYGAMHPEIAQCLRMVARLNYITGDYMEAMAFQQKAVLMSERVNGVDHPQTITEYANLALYCFANHQVGTSLKLLYRARYLMLLAHGETHPQVALLDSNIGLILHAVGEYELALRFLEKSLALNTLFYGPKAIKVAISHHLVARTQSCIGDFRSALQSEKETFSIYKHQLGETHEKTLESSECLRHLTQQAVVLQKKMNELYTSQSQSRSGQTSPSGPTSTGGATNGLGSIGNNKFLSTLTLSPLSIPPPTLGSVLDMLNMINGILFVQISQLDIENFRREVEKNSSLGGGSGSPLSRPPALTAAKKLDEALKTDSNANTELSSTEKVALSPGLEAGDAASLHKQIIRETFQLVSKRDDNVCNFLEGGTLIGGSDFKLIYRHYATLYFVFCVDSSESELGILDLIQVFVETLDKCFENVCELDLIFHVDKVHYILNELVMGGMVLETNMTEILTRIEEQNRLEKQEAGISAAPARAMSAVKNINFPQQIKDIKLPDLPSALKDTLKF